jgi:ABC-2 type transport system ATP-binding protein
LKQRVGLAHAMMSDPEILILDEPTSGLDPNQIVEIREIIRKIGQEKTVILSTHILSEAEATCDRIVIINKGRIIADGSTQELTAGREGDRQIQVGLMGVGTDDAAARLKEVPGVADVMPAACDEADTIRLNVVCRSEGDVRPDLYAAVKSTDWVLVELSREAKNLETIFRELTREN